MKKMLLLITLLFIQFSCKNREDLQMNQVLKIEFQHFHGCPNSKKLMQNLKNAMKDYEDRIVLTEIIVDTQELAIKYKFRGSPTILINGKDLEGITEPNEPSLTCRLYANDLPSTEEIKAKIIESLK